MVKQQFVRFFFILYFSIAQYLKSRFSNVINLLFVVIMAKYRMKMRNNTVWNHFYFHLFHSFTCYLADFFVVFFSFFEKNIKWKWNAFCIRPLIYSWQTHLILYEAEHISRLTLRYIEVSRRFTLFTFSFYLCLCFTVYMCFFFSSFIFLFFEKKKTSK